MRDYTPFIAPAYAITALVFLGLIVSSLGHARRWKQRFEERNRR